jgi:hypothetical protein
MRFRGAVGFAESQETAPGVWKDIMSEHTYSGDVERDIGRVEPSGDKVNNDIAVNNQISILADAFAANNIKAMRYVRWNGVNWKISSVEVRRPRLVLNIGGLWDGDTP